MSRRKSRAHYRRHFSFYVLHRYFGILVAVFILLLASTGIMLNHTESLGLDERKVDSEAVLEWYGIHSHVPETGFRIAKGWISHREGSVFFNTTLLNISMAGLTGALSTNNLTILAGEQKLILLTQTGELVDILSRDSGLPDGKMLRLGLSERQQPVLETESGRFVPSADYLSWNKTETSAIHWSEPAHLPQALKQGIKQNWRGEGITSERLVLDLHSGRLFGSSWGVLLMDMAGLFMILLVITGIRLWYIRWRKRAVHVRAYKHHHLSQDQ